MKRLVQWVDKEARCALPLPISEDGDTVPMDDICEQLAMLYDMMDGLEDDEAKEVLDAAREDRSVIPPGPNWGDHLSHHNLQKLPASPRRYNVWARRRPWDSNGVLLSM